MEGNRESVQRCIATICIEELNLINNSMLLLILSVLWCRHDTFQKIKLFSLCSFFFNTSLYFLLILLYIMGLNKRSFNLHKLNVYPQKPRYSTSYDSRFHRARNIVIFILEYDRFLILKRTMAIKKWRIIKSIQNSRRVLIIIIKKNSVN